MKKLILILLCTILLIGVVSAWEWDNVKSYDENTKTITISNSILKLIPTSEIAKIKLNTPINFLVPQGYHKVAEFEVYSYFDYENALKNMEFYRIDKNLVPIEREFDYKYKVIEDFEVDDYENQCTNITKFDGCEKVKIGSHTEKRERWIELNKTSFSDGETKTIGIFTNVQKGDNIEWIPTFYGVKINEWASWSESLFADLDLWYNFDASSGTTVEDYQGNYTGTAYNIEDADWEAGVIGNGLHLNDGTNDEFVNTTYNPTWAVTDPFSISFWMKAENEGTAGVPRMFSESGSSDFIFQKNGVDADDWRLRVIDENPTTTNYVIATPISTGAFVHVVIVRDIANDKFRFYVNGISISNATDGSTDDIDLSSYPLWIGMSDAYAGTNINMTVDLFGIWSRALTNDEVISLYNEGNGLKPAVDNPPSITLISPVDYYNTTSQSILFNGSVSDDLVLENVSLIIDSKYNQTNSSGLNNSYYFWTVNNLAEGSHTWTYEGCDDKNQCTNASAKHFEIDLTYPILSVGYNLTDLVVYSLPTNSTWYFNATETNLASCYYNTSEDATFQIITCNETQKTTWASGGTKTIQFCANDTVGHETCNTTQINVYSISYTQYDNPDPVVEGFYATFNLTLNLSSIPTTTANLILNGTVYSPTITRAGTNGYYFETTIAIPQDIGNITGDDQDWFWNYTISGIASRKGTSNETITVYELAIDDCSVYGELILNLSLKDEETKLNVNATAGSNVEIDLQLTSKDNSSVYLAYNNTWTDDNNPQVCIPLNVLNDTQYWIDFTIGFDSTDRVWEFYYLEDGTLNSSKVFDAQTDYTIDLMDLKTADSTSFLFNYFDQDGLPVDDAMVHVFRKYIGSGTFLEVERSKSDQNGDTILHLVEEDVIYYFLITQYGDVLFTSSTYTALCQATPCTIQIEASGGFVSFPTDYDLVDGGVVAINSSASQRKVSLVYSLNHTADMNLTIYKYNSDGSYSAINSSEETGTSGIITLNVPQSAGNVSFFASIVKDDQFIKSEWIDFEEKTTDVFGVTLSLFLAGLIILTLGLVAVTEGASTIVMVVLGVFLAGALGLITTRLNTGINIVVYLILAGGLIIWKLTRRKD